MGQPKPKDKPAESSDAAPPTSAEASAGWQPAPASASRWVIGAAVLLVNLPLLHFFLLRPAPAATASLPFQDDYSQPATVAQRYWSSGGLWRTVDGWLLSPGVKNNPLWLRASLPQDVAVEFDVRSMSPEGDIKVEIFGDGVAHSSGYIIIFGGWKNSLDVIARLDEHGQDRKEQASRGVVANKVHRLAVERYNGTLRFEVDGQQVMTYPDAKPLVGPGHDRFAFNDWAAPVRFDNIAIWSLE